jgi:NAD(P)H-dependent flavin oxidoreductase YrpB (nitropropane dioxygenase family)
MGDIAVPRLASAVANAGALGMIQPNNDRDPRHVEKMLEETRALTTTGRVFGTNFLVPEAYVPDLSQIFESVEVASKMVRVVQFFYREPEPKLIEIVHKGGALAFWQVGSKEEAIVATDAGCDVIVAQGMEAGGHLRGKLGLHALLGEVLDAVEIPVLAAGGIGSGRDLAAVLSAGASGVTMGTRFVAAEESPAHPEYVNALIESKSEDTVITEAFSYGWPNAPHRVLRSSIEAAQSFKGDVVARKKPYGIGEWFDIHKFECDTITRDTEGTISAMPHWAGEGVNQIHRVQSAADIVRELSSEAEMILNSQK